MSASRARLLQAGDVFVMHPDCGDKGREYEVTRVSLASASVRPLVREHRTVNTPGGIVEFDAPGRAFQISPTASVIVTRTVEVKLKSKKKGL